MNQFCASEAHDVGHTAGHVYLIGALALWFKGHKVN